jgi:lipoprotein LpqS
MRYNDARTARRLRSAAALCVVCWMLVIGGEWGFLWPDAPSPHAHHAVATASITDFAVVTEHPHLQDGSTPAPPEVFTAAVLPRATTALIALGLITAVVFLACSSGRGALPTMRGPPRALAPVLSGQQTLARFCVSRR